MARPDNDEEDDQKPVFKHFSHEHSLAFINKTDQTNPVDITCSGCNIGIIQGKGYFACESCQFALHGFCYKMKRNIHHLAEPGHELILFSLPSFECKACGDSGSGFGYVCNVCSHVYHGLCMSKPESTSYDYHAHKLKLAFSRPYGPGIGFRCDVCQFPGYDHWLYRCTICEFDAHLSCALSNKPPSQINQRISEPVAEASTSPSPGSDQARIVRPSPVAAPHISTNFAGSSSSMQYRSFPGNVSQAGSNFSNAQIVQVNHNLGSASAHGSSQAYYVSLQPTNQSFRYENQVGFGSNQGRLNGASILGAAVSGLGQGIFQEILHTVVTGPGDGAASSDPGSDYSDISCNWFGDSDYY